MQLSFNDFKYELYRGKILWAQLEDEAMNGVNSIGLISRQLPIISGIDINGLGGV